MNPMTEQQKEFVMLWVLLSANPTFSPATGLSDAQIFLNITTAVRAVLTAAWNWPGAGATAAKTLVTAAVNTHLAAAAAGNVDPYTTVSNDFQTSVVAAGAWPPDQGDHPRVAELVATLGIQ
jgi:hypothetical protein